MYCDKIRQNSIKNFPQYKFYFNVQILFFPSILLIILDVRGEYIWEDGTVTSWTEANVNLFY